MPNQDGTGPAGKGPKTGRGLGKCEGAQPANRPGVGRGRGRGQGLGLGRQVETPAASEDSKSEEK